MIRGCGASVALVLALLALAGAGAGAGEGGRPGDRGPAAAGDAARLLPPLRGGAVTQGFGCTAFAAEPLDAECPSGHFHSGIDLAAPSGTPVVAAATGRAHVVRSRLGFGLHVLVDHGGGLTTLYGHLSAAAVADGDTVDAGEQVGEVGSTGSSTGPHLHFEVRRDGVPEDPLVDVALP